MKKCERVKSLRIEDLSLVSRSWSGCGSRVAGDWTNAGTISAVVAVFTTQDPIPQFSARGQLADQQTVVFPVVIPSGVKQAEFRLGWCEDWGRYPNHDMNLFAIAPNGLTNLLGATSNNPEVVVVINPAPSTWRVMIRGFDVNTGSDKYEVVLPITAELREIRRGIDRNGN